MKTFYHKSIILGLIVLCIYLWRGKKYSETVSINSIEALTSDLKEFKTKQGLWASEKQAFEGTEKDLKQIIKTKDAALQNALKTFKKPVAAASIKTIVEIDTVFIPYDKTVDFEFSRTFQKEARHYSIHGAVNKNGINIAYVTIPNTQTLVIGKKKVGFLKYETTVDVINSNPLIKVDELEAFSFKSKPKRFGLGIFVGYSTELEVVIGAGVSYNLISF